MRKITTLALFILFLSVFASANDFKFQIQGNAFFPSYTAFKDIYSGGFMYGFEIDKGVWKRIRFWMGAKYFEKLGELTYTKERTRVNMLPLGFGVKYIYHGKENINLYARLGLRYYVFRESNTLGKVEDGNFGFVLGIGGSLNISKKIFFDLFLDYSSCKFKPADYKIQIGGIESGLGFGYIF
jgi:hypothetical protein